MSIRIFNADDHPILRKGIIDLLVQTENMEWVGSAENGQEAYDKIKALNPDIAVLDIEMPFMNGLEVATKLIKEGSNTSFILLTLFKDESFFRNAIKNGIMGYLLKESSEQEIIDCIRSVYRGQAYVNPSLSHFLIQGEKTKNHILDKLSDHEIKILQLISRNMTSNQIAEMMFISSKTVSNHRNNISKKLDLSGEQNGLLKWAINNKVLLE